MYVYIYDQLYINIEDIDVYIYIEIYIYKIILILDITSNICSIYISKNVDMYISKLQLYHYKPIAKCKYQVNS